MAGRASADSAWSQSAVSLEWMRGTDVPQVSIPAPESAEWHR
jgi:hypothetical protein